MIAARQRRCSARHEGRGALIVPERYWIDAAGRFYSWNRRELIDDRVVGAVLLRAVRMMDSRQVQRHRHDPDRIEPGGGRAQIKEALDQQAGAGQQQERERNLRDDEKGTEPIGMPSARRAFRSLLERLVHRGPRNLESGNKSEEQRASNREHERKQGNAWVHL